MSFASSARPSIQHVFYPPSGIACYTRLLLQAAAGERTRCPANLAMGMRPGAWWARMRAPTAARTSSSHYSSSPTLSPSAIPHVKRRTRDGASIGAPTYPVAPGSLLGLGRAGQFANPAASTLYPAKLAARPPQASSPGTSRPTVTSTSTSTPPLAGSHAMSRADKLGSAPAMRQPPRLRCCRACASVAQGRPLSQGAQPNYAVHGV